MSRTFQVPKDRHLTLPQGLLAGPGATNLRLQPGAVVTLDDDRCQAFQRFLNGRKNAGDLVEIAPEDAPTDAPAPIAVAQITRSRTGESGERELALPGIPTPAAMPSSGDAPTAPAQEPR